jgi:hypothetical protein
MSNQIVTVIVEDAPIVDKLQSSRTTIEKIVVGTPNDSVQVPVGWTASESITVGDGNSVIGDVVNDVTQVEKIIVGTPVRIGDTINFGGLDSAEVIALINANVQIDSAAIVSLSGEYSPLVWDSDGEDARIVTGYRDPVTKTVATVRNAEFENYSGSNDRIRLTLATFAADIGTGAIVYYDFDWDVPATGFNTSVTNPDDFPSQFINSVIGMQVSQPDRWPGDSAGSRLAAYSTSGPSPTPAGGVDWTQSWTTDEDSFIYDQVGDSDFDNIWDEDTSNIEFTADGSEVGIALLYKDNIGTTYGGFGAEDETRQIFRWNDPSLDISVNNVSGNTFLQTYTSTGYSVTVTNMQDTVSNVIPSAYSGDGDATVILPTNTMNVAIGNANPSYTGPFGSGAGQDFRRWPDAYLSAGTLSSTTGVGSGTFTFAIPVHKDDLPQGSGSINQRTISSYAKLNRPQGIGRSGNQYVSRVYRLFETFTASFTYPSFWIFTAGTGTPPTRAEIVDGDGYDTPTVSQLSDETRDFAGSVENPAAVPQAFWFGVRSSADQPTRFQTGSSPALLSDVSKVDGSVSLEPDVPPSNYVAEDFNLYGIVLQPGTTYVSIGT